MGILLTESKIIDDDPENYMPFFLKNPPRLFESLFLRNKIKFKKSMVGPFQMMKFYSLGVQAFVWLRCFNLSLLMVCWQRICVVGLINF